MVRGWQDFTSASFDCQKMEGHHLWPLQPTSKMAWLQHIATGMDAANTSPSRLLKIAEMRCDRSVSVSEVVCKNTHGRSIPGRKRESGL